MSRSRLRFPALVLLLIGSQTLVSAQRSQGSPCQVSEGPGRCELLDKCQSVYDDLVAGKRPEFVCGYKNTIPIICCPNSGTGGGIASPTTPSRPSWETTRRPTMTTRQGQNYGNARRAKQMCHEYAKSVYALIQPPILTGGDTQFVNTSLCAIKSKKLIVGGTKAEPKEFPHMAAIGYGQSSNIQWNCGGSLISDLWVVTAAHCLTSNQWGNAEHIRVGDLNLNSDSDDARPQTRRVAQRVKHPNYKRPAQYNDIALIKMDRPVTFDAYVRPACLYLGQNVPANTKTVVSGWGIVDWFDDKGSPDLLKVTLPTVSYETCKRHYADEGNKLPNGIDSNTQLCAGEDGKDTCQGDSGGPLMVYSTSEECMYDIMGVTSFGKLCGSVTPGIYTKIYAYLDWIEKTVWP